MRAMLILVAAILAISCAKPNYQNPSHPSTQKQNEGTCQLAFTKLNVCADLEWLTLPSNSQHGTFLLKYYRPQKPDELIEPSQTPAVILWHPAMGHPSTPVKIANSANGVYVVSDVNFLMPGEWEIRLQLKDGANVIDQVTDPFTY